MPELPNIVTYIEALEERVLGARLERITLYHPFLLRSVEPPPESCHGQTVSALHRAGKQIGLELSGGQFIALHLMIAGRLKWLEKPPASRGGKAVLADFAFSSGVLRLTEAGSKRRAALRILPDRPTFEGLRRGGVEPLECSTETLAQALGRENHTLKRALTDPRIVSGIGNAYSDEILHAAGLSPFLLTGSATGAQIETLHNAIIRVLNEWITLLRTERDTAFPGTVTAFHPQMSVHGRFDQPCPVCGTTIQRIRYAENETNYCPRCQTEGKVYADRALSRLLKNDWPRDIDELERLSERGGVDRRNSG